MHKLVIRYLALGQICLYGGLLACVLLKPHGLTANDGVSYYGVYAKTVIPYSIALLGAASFSLLAARELTIASERHVRLGLAVFALLLAGITITPYSASTALDYMHTALGSALFSLQLILSGWLAFWCLRNVVTIGLWLVELAGGIASAFYLNPTHGYLLESQLIFQMAFGALLIYVLARSDLPPHSGRSPALR